jgi:hypothetical protein
MIGAGIGIGAGIWAGHSSITTVSPANNAAPPNSPTKGLPGDSSRSAVAVFSVGTGVKVSIIGGGSGPDNSNCTNDQTDTSFTTNGDNEPHLFKITAKSSGTCFYEASYSNFKVTLSGPGITGSGRMFLGQFFAGTPYFPSCASGGPTSFRYEWSGAKCALFGTTPADTGVEITRQ